MFKMLLTCMLMFSVACAADGEIVPISKPAVTSNTDVKTTVETQPTWSYIVSNVMVILDPVIKVALTTLASCVLVVVAKHFNMQISATQQDMVRNAAATAVAKAEVWADAHAATPSSNDKLNYAVNAVKVVAGSDVVKGYTNDQLSHYVEEAVLKAFGQPDPIVQPDPVVTPPKV